MMLVAIYYPASRGVNSVPYTPPADFPRRRWRPSGHRVLWWTRERVIAGLLRFYHERGFAATSTAAYHRIAKSAAHGPDRRYPPGCAVLRYFRTFREAWTAVGVDVDHAHEDYRPEEHWFIREAAGLLTRREIAVELKRTPTAIHSYLRDHGLHSYEIRGWTANRVTRVAGVPGHVLNRYMDRGDLPYLRGSKCIYFDPADLLLVEEIDWANPPAELEAAVRRSLLERLVNTLSGRDWTAGCPYQVHPIRTTDRRWRPALLKAPPKPTGITAGDTVRCVRRAHNSVESGRVGTVELVYYRRNSNHTRLDSSPQWMARVRFDKTRVRGEKGYVAYALPIAALEVIDAHVGREGLPASVELGRRQEDHG